MDLSRRYGAKPRAGASCAKLAEAVLDAMPTDAGGLLRDSIMLGDLQLSRVLDIFEANGMFVAAVDDVDALKVLPTLAFPAVAIFRYAGSYVAVMPDVVREALEAADVGALRDRAHRFDVAFRCAGLAATFAGVTDAQALASDWERLSILEPTDEVLDALDARTTLLETPFGVIRLNGEPHVAAGAIADSVLDGPGGARRVQPLIRGIQAAHEGIERRSVADLAGDHDYEEVWGYLQDQAAFRELTHYLDAHVPEGEGDLQFADLVLERLCGFCGTSVPDDVTTEALTRIVGEFGLVVAEADRDLFEGLLADLIDTVPNWYANGWPATRLQRRQ